MDIPEKSVCEPIKQVKPKKEKKPRKPRKPRTTKKKVVEKPFKTPIEMEMNNRDFILKSVYNEKINYLNKRLIECKDEKMINMYLKHKQKLQKKTIL